MSNRYKRKAHKLYQSGQLQAALQQFQRALKLEPRDIDALLGVALSYFQLADNDKAAEVALRILDIDSSHPRACALLGTLYSDGGDFLAAAKYHQRAFAQDPGLSQSAYALARNPESMLSDDDLAILEGQIAHSNNNDHRARCQFALAETWRRRGNYQISLTWLRRAHQGLLGLRPYDGAQERQQLEQIVATEQGHQNKPVTGAGNHLKPIFILGLPRCGSTLLEQILATDPHYGGVGESSAFIASISGYYAELKGGLPTPAGLLGFTRHDWERVASRYVDYVRASKLLLPDEQSVDKQLYNHTFVGSILRTFPQATVVDLRRRPLDQFISCYSTLFGYDRGFSHSASRFSKALNNYSWIMAHWRAQFPEHVLRINYETLVTHPEQALTPLLNRLGIRYSEEMMNFHTRSTLVTSASQAQVRRPLYRSSVGRWQHYRQWLQDEEAVLITMQQEYLSEQPHDFEPV